jgi:hypothetical protein
LRLSGELFDIPLYRMSSDDALREEIYLIAGRGGSIERPSQRLTDGILEKISFSNKKTTASETVIAGK